MLLDKDRVYARLYSAETTPHGGNTSQFRQKGRTAQEKITGAVMDSFPNVPVIDS
jgi:hypothetical protein